jgi:hypothetical protein
MGVQERLLDVEAILEEKKSGFVAVFGEGWGDEIDSCG